MYLLYVKVKLTNLCWGINCVAGTRNKVFVKNILGCQRKPTATQCLRLMTKEENCQDVHSFIWFSAISPSILKKLTP